MANNATPKVSSFDIIVFASTAFATQTEQAMLPTGAALQYVKPVISYTNYPISVVMSLDIENPGEDARRWEAGSRTDLTEKAALRAVEINLIQRDQKLTRLMGRGIRPGDIIFLIRGEIGAMVLSDNTLYYLDKNDVLTVRGGLYYLLTQPNVIADLNKRSYED